jgi:hypothetical protein
VVVVVEGGGGVGEGKASKTDPHGTDENELMADLGGLRRWDASAVAERETVPPRWRAITQDEKRGR